MFEEWVYQDPPEENVTVRRRGCNKAEATSAKKQLEVPAEYRQFLQSEFQGKGQLLRDKIMRSLLIEQLFEV